ncbi:MAG: hypothetical protein AAF732_09415 [Pseudomonadota bacterium]
MVEGIVIWGVVILIAGITGAFVASSKNRDWSAWTAWSIIFPPSLLVLFLLPRNRGPAPRRPTLDEEDLPS